jgi:hypothetical protein
MDMWDTLPRDISPHPHMWSTYFIHISHSIEQFLITKERVCVQFFVISLNDLFILTANDWIADTIVHGVMAMFSIFQAFAFTPLVWWTM